MRTIRQLINSEKKVYYSLKVGYNNFYGIACTTDGIIQFISIWKYWRSRADSCGDSSENIL